MSKGHVTCRVEKKICSDHFISRLHQLTHSQENVLDLQWLESNMLNPEEVEMVVSTVSTHLQHLLEQRDAHLEVWTLDGTPSFMSSPCCLFADHGPQDRQLACHMQTTSHHFATK